MKLIACFMRLFFRLLYHPLAFTYDLVAWTVSLGLWKDWVRSVAPYIQGTRILELGHGPGHLQRTLLNRGLLPFGLDESPQMGTLAKANLRPYGYAQPRLIRGLGQELPFPTEYFDTVVATFPAEYIFEAQTMSEIWRTLKNGGRLIILPVAWFTGKGMLNKVAAWLFKVTGQAPSDLSKQAIDQLANPFEAAGFEVKTELLEVKLSNVLIIIAKKVGTTAHLTEKL